MHPLADKTKLLVRLLIVLPAEAVGNLMGHAGRVHRWPDDDGAGVAGIGYGKCAIGRASILHGEVYRHRVTVARWRRRVEDGRAACQQQGYSEGTHSANPASAITCNPSASSA